MVVDATGAPIEGAGLWIHGRSAVSGEGVRLWDGRDNAIAHTGPAGTFSVVGAQQFLPESIRVERDGYLPASVTCQAGEHGMIIRLETAVQLAIDLQVPVEVAEKVRILVFPDLEVGPEPLSSNAAHKHRLVPVDDGPDRLAGLPAARLELQLRCSVSDQVLACVEGIECGGGGVIEDPRLLPLACPDLEVRTLEVLGLDAEAVRNISVYFPELPYSHRGWMRPNPIAMVCAGDGPLVELRIADFLGERLRLERRTTKIEPRPGIPVRFELVGDGAQAAGAEFRVSTSLDGWTRHVDFEDGVAEVRLHAEGELQYHVRLRFTDRRGSALLPLSEETVWITLELTAAVDGAPLLVQVPTPAEQIADLRATQTHPKD